MPTYNTWLKAAELIIRRLHIGALFAKNFITKEKKTVTQNKFTKSQVQFATEKSADTTSPKSTMFFLMRKNILRKRAKLSRSVGTCATFTSPSP